MTKKEKEAIIAKGKEEAEAKAKAEADEAAKKKANADESEDESEPVEGEDESEEDESAEDEEIDYADIAKQEAERAEKAEKALAEQRFKDSEARRNAGESKEKKDNEDENKPLTLKDLNRFRQEDRQAYQKEFNDSRALEIARVNTTSEEEAKAAHLIWKNRVVPTGNLEEDVLFAIGGLNRRKYIAKNKEMVRTIKSKNTVSRDANGAYKAGERAPENKMSSNDAQAMKAAGMVWDGAKRVYKKPLNNGKGFYYYDPKTKKQWKGI